MPKVAVITPQRARDSALPPGFAGPLRATAYCNRDADPIQVYLHRLAAGEDLRVGPIASDCVLYVWQGSVTVGAIALAAGSSATVEHGAKLELYSIAGAMLISFSGSKEAALAHGRAGGHVHLLPAERVPRADVLEGSQGVGGAIHADAQCPSCEVWLHENHFAPAEPLGPEASARGIHSHSESEVIFVTAGSIRLGQKLFPSGTAVAIAADTFYHIAPGPEGMSFINFRAGTPSDIRFANGMTISETGYWQQRLPRPAYLQPA
jgi:hypothetical protein